MSFATSDLASVLVAPEREFAGFAQGVLRAWNSDTFENTVHVRGSDLHDLPVASGVEALTYQPGDVLMLTRWRPGGGGTASWWIGMGGRVVYPGSGRAEDTVSFLRGELARSIALETVGSAIVAISPSDNPFSFGQYDAWHSPVTEITGSPVTYEQSGIEIGPSGEALVLASADFLVSTEPGQLGQLALAAEMERESDGVVEKPADLFRAVALGRAAASSGETAENPRAAISKATRETGLVAGETYTVRGMVYQNVDDTDPSAAGVLSESSIVVIPI